MKELTVRVRVLVPGTEELFVVTEGLGDGSTLKVGCVSVGAGLVVVVLAGTAIVGLVAESRGEVVVVGVISLRVEVW